MRKTTDCMINVLRIILQIIGTYYVGKCILEKVVSIPASTWGWMAISVITVLLLIVIWLYPIVGGRKRGRKDDQKQ